MIRYEVIKIDRIAEAKAECVAAGETFKADDYGEELNEPDFIPLASITIRELDDYDIGIVSDNPQENKDLGKEVCRLSGWLIMSNLMRHYGYDPHMICDAFSADIEYVWSALNDDSMSAATVFDVVKNVFYADSIYISPEYDNARFKEDYLEGLLGHLIQIINGTLDEAVDQRIVNKRWKYGFEKDHYIDVICYFPAPLPFDNSARQKKMDLACGLVSQISADAFERMMKPDAEQEQTQVEIKVAPEIYMRAAGMRISGEEPYPESAKNRTEWDLLEAAGWYECGNSRLLYMTALDIEVDDDD